MAGVRVPVRLGMAMRAVPDEVWAVLTLIGEARGESYLGKVAVAEVIRNRMTRKFLSDGTVVGTVLKPYQFSCWNTNDGNRLVIARTDLATPAYRECLRAWEESLTTISTQGAVAYLNPAILPQLPSWYDETKVTLKEGHHVFLKL